MTQENLRAALQQIRDIADCALKGSLGSGKQAKSQSARAHKPHAVHSSTISFSSNPRAFMKKYSKGLSGPKKLTLLAARLAKGKSGQSISLDELSAEWNRMKTVMGGAYNAAYVTRAKEQGWIDHKKGSCTLSDTWQEVLGAS